MRDEVVENIKKEAESIDYSAIGAMLCGKELDEKQQEEVRKFHNTYDRVNELKKAF
jgi:hypothetical protein